MDMVETTRLLLQKAMYQEYRTGIEPTTALVFTDEDEDCHMCDQPMTMFVCRNVEDPDDYVCNLCAMALAYSNGFARGMDESMQVAGHLMTMAENGSDALGMVLAVLASDDDDDDDTPKETPPTTGMYL